MQYFAFWQIWYANILGYFELTNMTWNEETRILKADEGKWVTEDDINFAIEVKLAPSENVSNWHEVDVLPPKPEPDEEKMDYLANEYINTEPEE